MSSAGQIVGEIIKSPISLKIRDHFKVIQGEETIYPNVYKEQTLQDFEKPCFFIWTIDVDWEKISTNRYEGLYQMNIRYHTSDEDEHRYETLCGIGTELLDCLETIEVPISLDGVTEKLLPVVGFGLEFKIEDDILQFFANYKIKARRPVSEIKMETLGTSTTTK